MNRIPVAGGWYGFSTLQGDWATLMLSDSLPIQSSRGPIQRPVKNNVADKPLYLVGATKPNGNLVMGGQSQNGYGTWVYNKGEWKNISPLSFGVSPCAFSQDGKFFYFVTSGGTGSWYDTDTEDIVPFNMPFFVDGIRAVIPPFNSIILGNTTQFSPNLNVYEYITFDDGTVVGQSPFGGLLVIRYNVRYIIEPGGVFFIRCMYDGFNFAIATVKQDEKSTVIWNFNANELFQFPHEVKDPIPVIGKPLDVAWFEFNRPPAVLPPGNAVIRIRYGINNSVIRFNGIQFAEWVSGSTVEEIEQICQNSPWPCIAYWDGRDWPRWPNLKHDDWLGMQWYCHADESPTVFELNMRAWIGLVPIRYQIAGICQVFDSNTSLTKDLKSLVPIYAKLARDISQVTMLAPFSDQDRPTGLNDHPELRPLWQELFDGVTGEPMSDNGVVDGVLVDPQKYFFSLVNDRDPNDYANVLNSIKPDLGKYGIGQQASSSCVPRGRLYLPTAICPNAKPLPGQECLAVRQDPKCWEAEGLAVNCVGNGQWSWSPMGDMSRYVPISEQPPSNEIGITIFDYTNPARRSDTAGLVVKFEIGAADPVERITFELNDGDKPFIWNWDGDSKDGRYYRVIGFKVTVEGNFTMRVTATDVLGNTAFKDVPVQVVP